MLAINDLHGNLLPPTGSSGAIQVGPATTDTVAAGGVEYLKTWVDRLRKRRGHDKSYFVGAGDLIGASPLLSGLFHDEPTIEALNLMHMRYSARPASCRSRGASTTTGADRRPPAGGSRTSRSTASPSTRTRPIAWP